MAKTKKYYKLLPESLQCKDFQYQEGLNVDTNVINDEECSYGLHFASAEHILDFLNYGTMIADVEIPEDAIFYDFKSKCKANKIILKNIRSLLSVDVFRELIANGANIHAKDDWVLDFTIKLNNFELFQFLVEQGADIHVDDDYMLTLAARKGLLPFVKFLVEHGADIHVDDDAAFFSALKRNHIDVVKYLVEQGANIHLFGNAALKIASDNGYLELVKFLKAQP